MQEIRHIFHLRFGSRSSDCWDRGRPARKRPDNAQVFESTPKSSSRFALIAGGTPAVPTIT